MTDTRLLSSFVDVYLTNSLDYFTRANPGQREGVIIKIDPARRYAKHKLFSYPLSDRNPKMIVPLPYISADDIMEVYVRDPANFDRSLVPAGAILKSIRELPDDRWLAGKYMEDMTVDQIDPANPHCRLFYTERAAGQYRKHIMEGRVAFALRRDYRYFYPRDEIDSLIFAFGEEIFHSDRKRVRSLSKTIAVKCLPDTLIEGVIFQVE